MSPEAAREELDRVLGGAAFASSQRSREFLRYVVEESLAGRAVQIKERSIAMAIFGRGADYDPGEDSIVRVKAVEVRKRLTQHYSTAQGSPIRIDLPQGAYVPRIEMVVGDKPQLRHRWAWRLAVGLVILAALAALVARQRGRTPLDELWGPLVSSRSLTLIGLPSPEVWTVDVPSRGPVPEESLYLVRDFYVGTGAAYGAAQVASMLASRGGKIQIKIGQAVSYEDLKSQPAVFLGAHSSVWTMEFSRKLRFQFQIRGEETGLTDTQSPGREWMRTGNDRRGGTAEDYALVARIFDRNTGNPVLLVAGCGVRGTHAAAEFVSSEAAFSQFAAAAPSDWGRRNFEVVLHAEVHGAVPGKPRVVAWHVW